MKDILSYGTAVRLKEAGFPQPKPEVGQFWYMEGFDMPRIAIIGSWNTADQRPVYRYIDANTWDFPDERTAVFAPSITDLLLAISTGGLEVDCGMFSVWTSPPIEYTSGWSAPEELANAWIELKVKK